MDFVSNRSPGDWHLRAMWKIRSVRECGAEMSLVSRYKTWKKSVYKRRLWNIGFVDFNEDTIHQPLDISWLEHDYKDGWFADPFIIQDDGEWLEVLVEQFVYAQDNGHIAKLVVRRDGGRYYLKEIVPVIDDGTHFSFPNVYRQHGQIFIYPENWQSGGLNVYRYDPRSGQAEPDGSLIAEPLIDAVITEAFGVPRLFATHENRDPCGQELEVYVSASGDWRGPYTRETHCVFPDRVARGGGQFFPIGNQLIRVAQDNNGVYGGGLVFFETHYDGENFSFTEIAQHLPRSRRYNLGLHTFNVNGAVAAVDGRGYAHPLKRTVYQMKRCLGLRKRIGDAGRSTVVR